MSTAEQTIAKTNNESAKKQLALKMAQYQDEYYDAIYAKKSESVETQMGDWIFQNYGNMKISTGDYVFIMEGETAPYKITILEDSKIKKKVTGNLSAAGKVTWD